MPALSFMKQFKEKLLLGEKQQTIRKQRKNPIKVGDNLSIYINQRQKKVFGCPECGSTNVQDDTVNPLYFHCRDCNYNPISDLVQVDGSDKLFDAVCTSTWLIEMQKNPHNEGGYLVKWGNLYFTEKSTEIQDLAKRDSFNNAEEMFRWFDERYNLSTPQIFQVIRFKRIHHGNEGEI